jgi:peptidoglycan/xylan/chitin deacetylase (PgdA/CDA1 family)
MQFLQTEGYHVVDIHQLTDFLAFKATLPPKAVVLTFDDQSRLFYDLIFPILQEHQIPVTLFIAPPEVGTASMADWSQLKEMSEAGIDIQYRFSKELAGSLDQSHFPDRNRLMQIMTTLVSERDRIEMKIGQPCRYLAYPEGKLAALIVILSEKAGFSGGFNRKAGSNPFYRNRFVIQRDGVRWDEAIDSYRKHLAVFKKEVLR